MHRPDLLLPGTKHWTPGCDCPPCHPKLQGRYLRQSLLTQTAATGSPQLEGAAFALPGVMRSRLLLSVAHMPTIRETSEETWPGGPGQEPPASPSLDDYVRSICQLAQPTSVLDKVMVRSQPNRPRRPARITEKRPQTKSLEDSKPCFNGWRPTLPSAGTRDPLDWLFKESQEQQTNRRETATGACPSDGHWGKHKQMDKGREKLCEATVPEHSQDRYQTSTLKSWTSKKLCRASASRSSAGPQPLPPAPAPAASSEVCICTSL